MRPARELLPVEHSEIQKRMARLNRPCLHSILEKGLPRGETILFRGNGGFGVPEAAQQRRPLFFWMRRGKHNIK
jgi:hypothetical protein